MLVDATDASNATPIRIAISAARASAIALGGVRTENEDVAQVRERNRSCHARKVMLSNSASIADLVADRRGYRLRRTPPLDNAADRDFVVHHLRCQHRLLDAS